MKKLLFIFLSIGFFIFLIIGLLTNVYSQDLKGKWYMVNRSGLIEIEITEDALHNRKLFSDFTPKQKSIESQPYLKTENLDNKILLITNAQKDTSKYSALTIISLIKRQSFKIVWNTLDTMTTTIDDLINVHYQDSRELYGFLVFHEDYIDNLKKLKKVEDMTLSDFREFATTYVANLKVTRDEFDKYNIGYVAFTYNFQMIIQSLFEIGYNPIQNIETIERLYRKFVTDSDVENIFKEIKEQ